MNKKSFAYIKRICAVIISTALLLFSAGCLDEEEAMTRHIDISNMRDYYTHLKGDGTDTVTLMMYMIGSDLESLEGCATSDIEEIMSADLGSVNIILQTGGTKNWHNEYITDSSVQRHIINSGNITTVQELGDICMSTPESLSDFIKWSAANYPADRYCLIFWNHGGGTVLGYGSDELYPEEMLELSEIGTALSDSGVKFDFVGFDACLMGTIETAYMLEPYADYMIASEEYEPGTGWYYTDWLTALGQNPSASTVEIGKNIIDDFINGPDSSFWDTNTLSITDLREIPYVYEKLCRFMSNSENMLDSAFYRNVSDARYKAKSFGDGEFEQIDIISYLNMLDDIDGENELKDAIRSAVKYMDNSTYDANGLAMYFPYDYPEYYSNIISEIKSFGFGNESEGFFNKFLNIMAGGQIAAQSSEILHNDNDNVDYGQFSWYDDSTDVYLDEYDELEVIDKGEYFALSLSDEEWESINGINVQVYLDDEQGYIDLGCDNMYEFDDDGDLMVDFDYYWIALNGQIVPYYTEYESPDENNWYTYGYVPATLNNSAEIDIMLFWDTEHETGYVAGYRFNTDDESINIPQKGLMQFKNGDLLDFSCDYYTYDGEFDGVYSFGDLMEINGDIEVTYEYLGDFTTNICYELTDIYNNTFTTEMIELYME